MRASVSKSQNAFAFIILVLLLLDWAGVDALQSNPPAIIGFSISPTRPHYATIRENGLLEITNYQTSTVIGSYFVPLPGQDIINLDSMGYRVRGIAYSPDGNLVAASIADISSRGMIYLVDWQTGLIQQAYGQIRLNRIEDMSWSPDQSRLVVASLDGGADQILFSSIAIVNINSGELEQSLDDMTSIEGQAWSVVAWSPFNIIAYANDTTLVFWDANANTTLASVITSSRTLNSVWSPNGQYIATLHTDRTIQVWDINSGLAGPQQTLSIEADNFRSRVMSWLSDNLLAVNIWTDIEIWNVSSTSLEEVIETDHYIFGLGALDNNEIAFAGPHSVSTFPLTDLQTPTPVHTVTATSTSTMTPTASFTPTPTHMPSPTCTVTVAAGDALGLVNAVNAANNNGASADTICLEEGTYTFASASNAIALPSIATPITIVGNSAIIERGSGAPNFRLFNVTSSGALILEDLTLRNGNASGSNGGAILNAGSLTLDGVTLANNSARFGGGIHSSGSLVIRGSTLVTNSAVENGGAVYVNSGTLTLSDTTVESSSARYGSGVYLNNGTADLTGVIARANHATEQGAGVYQRTGTLTISGGLFESNTARFGNGVYVDAGTATISDVTMRENVAVEEGAGIYNRTGTVSVADSVFEDNQARYGAAISNRGTVSVAGSVFTGNIVQESGGAVYTTRSTSGNQVQQSCFEGNTARFGGAVFSSASGYDARDNWWGEVTGPTGAMVNGNVLTEPFLTDACPQ